MISYPGVVKNYQSYFDTPTKRNYLSLGVTLVTLIVLILMIYPAIIYIIDLNQQLAKTKKINQQLTEKIQSLNAAAVQLENLQTDLGVLNTALPSHAEVDKYLQLFEEEIDRSGSIIDSLQMNETQINNLKVTASAALVPVTYSATLLGDYDSLSRSLGNIEKISRITDITAASYTNREDQESELKLIIKGKTYFFGTLEKIDGGIPTP